MGSLKRGDDIILTLPLGFSARPSNKCLWIILLPIERNIGKDNFEVLNLSESKFCGTHF